MKPILLSISIIILSLVSCNLIQKVAWENNISNPENFEYVQEVAFNKGIPVHEVTQEMFNERYN